MTINPAPSFTISFDCVHYGRNSILATLNGQTTTLILEEVSNERFTTILETLSYKNVELLEKYLKQNPTEGIILLRFTKYYIDKLIEILNDLEEKSKIWKLTIIELFALARAQRHRSDIKKTEKYGIIWA